MNLKRKTSRKSTDKHLIHWQGVVVFAVFVLLIMITKAIKAVTPVVEQWQTQQQDYTKIFKSLLPSQGTKRTLLVFNNHAEQRFGGGFIGSIGLLTSRNGAVKIEPVRSVYFYDHRTREVDSYYPLPKYFAEVTGILGVRDSALYADWPQSAKLAAKMYEIETGIKPDNVVNITPEVLKSALEETGPIKLPEYDLTIDKNNILTTLQLEVEQGRDKRQNKDPKSILGVLAGKIISSLSEKKMGDLLDKKDKLNYLFTSKHISLYSTDKTIQEIIDRNKMSAAFNHFDGNLLAVTSTNYGINKSSPYVKQSIKQKINVANDGTATVKLTIVRNHTSDYKYQYDDPTFGNMWLVGKNITYNQIYIPKNSKLLSSTAGPSLVITRQSGRQVIGYDLKTDPLTAQLVDFIYQLPFKYDMNDVVTVASLFEKQVGGYEDQVELEVELPSSFEIKKANNRNLEIANDGRRVTWRGILESDKTVEFIYEKK